MATPAASHTARKKSKQILMEDLITFGF